jgi:hypothetical protein
MDRLSKFIIPENEEPLRGQDFLATTKEVIEEVQDLIDQEEESKELFMINSSL